MNVLIGLLILANLTVVFGAAISVRNKVPGICDPSAEGGDILKPGETKTVPGRCAQVQCGEDYYWFLTCGASYADGRQVDLSKPYPDCCSYNQ